MIYLQGNFTVF